MVVARDARSLVRLSTIHVPVLTMLRVCPEPHGTDSVGLQRSVIRIVFCWIIEQILTSPRAIASQISSARVISTLNNKHDLKVVAEQVLQSRECLGRKDRILPVLIQVICSCQEEQVQQSNADDRAIDTTIDSTTNTIDRHEEFVACDSISWR